MKNISVILDHIGEVNHDKDTNIPVTVSSFANRTHTPPFSQELVYVAATLIIFFLVFGVIANTLTITVILTSPKLRNVFNHFILSLCCSDLISACISWICLYRRIWGFDNFALPIFFCVLYWGADIWTSFVTAQHIASFAALRLFSIWKPLSFGKVKFVHIKIWIAIIWIVAFVCGFIPLAIMSGARYRDRNSPSPVARWPSCTQNEEWLQWYTDYYAKIGYAIFFYIPCIVVVTVTIAIILVMTRRRPPVGGVDDAIAAKNKKRRIKEKQAILQLLLIVGSFMVGYIPFTAFEFHTNGSTDNSIAAWRKDYTFGTVQYICLRFSECLNPIFYNLASTKMRLHTKIFLAGIFNKIGCANQNQRSQIKEKKQIVQTVDQSSQTVIGEDV